MAEKVKVSRSIAEQIEKWVRKRDENGHSDHYVLERLIIEPNLSEGESILALNAFVKGYKIEQTPEEKLVERFQYCEQRWGWHQDDEVEMKATAEAIKETLETLNIKIKGINE